MILQKNQHLESNSMANLSQKVFSLKKEETIILEKLTKKPLNKFQIYQKTKNYARVRLGREAVENWLSESKTRDSLLDLEYVIRKPVGRTNAGKEEYKYFLTTKGFFASLSSANIPERTYLFDNYLTLLKKRINDKVLFNIVKEYITSQIEMFLAWHYTHNINLHDLKQSRSYFHRFYSNIGMGFLEFPRTTREAKKTVKEVLERQYKHYTIMQFIDESANPKNKIPHTIIGFDKTLNKRIFSQIGHLFLEIERWFASLETYQDTNWKVQSHVIATEKRAEINHIKTNEEIKKTLQIVGYDDQFIETILHILEYKKIGFSCAEDQKNMEEALLY